MATPTDSASGPVTVAIQAWFASGYEQHFAEYSAAMREFLSARGATVVRRQLVERTIYGEASPSLVMLIDFADREVAERAFLEQHYLDILPLRNKVFQRFELHLATFGNI